MENKKFEMTLTEDDNGYKIDVENKGLPVPVVIGLLNQVIFKLNQGLYEESEHKKS